MCLVFVAWRAHPRYRLVVAANRDEYHARPTAPAAPWEAEPGPEPESRPGPADGGPRPARSPAPGAGGVEGAGAALASAGEAAGEAPGEAARTRLADAEAGAGEGRILAGRDFVGGGAWLGVTADGRFAALTNYRGSAPPGPDAPSRGRLVAGFLRSGLGARGYAHEAAREAERYRGFHLLLADRDAFLCVTNRGRGGGGGGLCGGPAPDPAFCSGQFPGSGGGLTGRRGPTPARPRPQQRGIFHPATALARDPGNAGVPPALSFRGRFTPLCGRDARVPRMRRSQEHPRRGVPGENIHRAHASIVRRAHGRPASLARGGPG